MKTKGLLILGVLLWFLLPQMAAALPLFHAAVFPDWYNLGCNQCNPGPGGVPPAQCPACDNAQPTHGMPQWWVSEPYTSLAMSDTPLSYTLSSGQELAFEFYYLQRTVLPASGEVHNYWIHPRGNPPHGVYPGLLNGSTCGTNASWQHNWSKSIQFWDAQWEYAWTGSAGGYSPPGYAVFSKNYEAFVYCPEGGIQYFYNTNNFSATASRDE